MLQISLKNALSTLYSRDVRRGVAFLRRELMGVAADFWKDGNWEKQAEDDPWYPSDRQKDASRFSGFLNRSPQAVEKPVQKDSSWDSVWHAAPGEISEKMWGQGFVAPADEYMADLMIRPMGLTKDMSMLDLAAGLGGRMRKTTTEFGIYINGREPDPEIAERGMNLSVAAGRGKRAEITAYDPMNLIEPRLYDCIIARETIYRVANKEKFINAIIGCCKPRAQISFTDYIVNPEAKNNPAIAAWRAFEKGANPVGLIEMAELWAKSGVSLRVHDDQTEYYKKEVKNGLMRFAKFMESGVKPDEPTRKAIEKRITTWAHRSAAMDNGMRLYRFYGVRG